MFNIKYPLLKALDFDDCGIQDNGPKWVKLSLPNGITYYGEVNDEGKPHGQGRMCECSSDEFKFKIYFGEFCNGQKSGKGKEYDMVHSSLTKGVWKDDRIDKTEYDYTGDIRLVHPDSRVEGIEDNAMSDIFHIKDVIDPSIENTIDAVREGFGSTWFPVKSSARGSYVYKGKWVNDVIKEGEWLVAEKVHYKGLFIDGKPDIPNFGYDPDITRIGFTND